MLKNVSIVDCAIEYSSIHCFNRLVSSLGIPLTYHHPPFRGINSLEVQLTQNAPSAYIIFGSTSNVCDRLEWQIDLSKFLKMRLTEGIPVLGICFGHQLIADSFGLPVEKNSNNQYFEGYRTIEFLKSGFGFKKGEKLNIITSHGYKVSSINDEFIHLAKSSECEFEVLAHSKYPLLSIQGHPEASDFFVNDLDVKINGDEVHQSQIDGLYFIKTFLRFSNLLE